MEVLRRPLTDPLVAPLLAGLTEEYATRYGTADEMTRASAAEFEPPAGCFLVLVDDGVTVAGGGLRFLEPGVCEVKRMWTSPAHRGKGHAATVLAALEAAALDAGYHTVRLETGPAQPEAIRLYERLGYHRIPVFGHYPRALAFEKALGPGQVGDQPAAN